MRSRTLGKTGLKVSELSLGTWGLSGDGYGPVAEGEAAAVVERARTMGITLFETSASYGKGTMVQILGDALGDDEGVTVVTRVGTDRSKTTAVKCFDPSFLTRSIESTRKQLGDAAKLIVLLHNPSARTLDLGAAASALADATTAGTITSWGVSVGDEDVARSALRIEAPVLSFSYNALMVQPLRMLSAELLAASTGVLAHSVLSYGLLSGRWAPSKQFRYGDHRADRWPDGSLRTRIRQLDAVRPLVSGDVPTMRSAALRFALSNDVISSVVLGPRNAAQLDQLVREAKMDPPYLPEAKLESLEKRLENLGVSR